MHLIETLTNALMALSSVSSETWAASVSYIVSRLNENGHVREWLELLLLTLMNELLGFLGSRELPSHHSTVVYIGFKEKQDEVNGSCV